MANLIRIVSSAKQCSNHNNQIDTVKGLLSYAVQKLPVGAGTNNGLECGMNIFLFGGEFWLCSSS